MAQELETFKSSKPAAAFASLGGEKHESLADGIGQGYAVIGYKGKNWTIRHDGESYPFTRTIENDDGEKEVTPMSYIDVIILRSAPSKSKSFYPKKEEGGGYDPESSAGRRPDCASLDGILPDDDVPKKQAESCGVCPRNVWKTMPNGKKGQDCTDYKRLAVCVLPSLAARIMGHPFQEPAFLRIPPASLGGLAKFGERMDGMGFHYSTFVTRISFDPDEPHPKFIYTERVKLTDKEAPFVLEMRESAIARRITGEDSHTGAVARLAQAQRLLALASPAEKQEAIQEPARPEPLLAARTPPNTQTTNFPDTATTASPSKKPKKKPVEDEEAATGFTVLESVSTAEDLTVAAVPSKAAVTQTAEDTGEVVEADAELEKKVNALLAKNKK
jgi:hypothetical protein